MKNETLALELTREEIEIIRNALQTCYETEPENADPQDIFWSNREIAGRLFEELDELDGKQVFSKKLAETYDQEQHDRISSAIKRGLAAEKANQKVKSGV